MLRKLLTSVFSGLPRIVLLSLLATALTSCATSPLPTTLFSQAETVAVYGASGKIGGLIVDEALQRGYKVLGVSRSPTSLQVDHAGFEAVAGDLTDADSVARIAAQADAIIISVAGTGEGNRPETSVHAVAAKHMVAVLGEMDEAPRVLQIGGATTMFGNAKAMQANMPFQAKKGSPMHGMLFGHRVALDSYLASDIDWTVLTPPTKILGWTPSRIDDGHSSRGRYRTSGTEFVIDEEGENSIFVRDLAMAAVDEIQNGHFIRERFTIGY